MKRILLGISAGIAAYKCPELVRRLRDHGFEVRVMMSAGAKQFVTSLSLQAVSGHSVRDDLFDPDAERGMSHIELAKWADLILIAPATANTVAKLAHGFADDLMSSVCLASAAPLAIAPAMNQQMWAANATQENIKRLKTQGVHVWGPDIGEQACGDHGPGRMLALEKLIEHALSVTATKAIFKNQTVVITAGPTREAIDPVRYISNRSSGKMGYALAAAAKQLGANVVLISGPTELKAPDNVTRINVLSAKDMQQAVMEQVEQCDLFIGAAAVADYAVANQSMQKIDSKQEQLSIELTPNPDIIAELAKRTSRPFCVGFAAQTHEVFSKAKQKLHNKKLDMIIANDVSQSDRGFDADQNAVTIIEASLTHELPLQTKTSLAFKILEFIQQRMES